MGVRLYGTAIYKQHSIDDNSKRKQTKELKQEENTSQNKVSYYTPKISASSSDILANYARAGLNSNRHKYVEIKDGHYKYEYKGARFDVYKKDNEYKSQFVEPKGFNREEFIEEFPNLEPQMAVYQTSSTLEGSINSINGEIDEAVSQGSMTGDCWLLSSIISMTQDEKGREIIKNSITVNSDDTVTVSFKGIGVSYTLTEAEITKYDTDNKSYDPYSNGDNDMLVLELAAEKLWKDLRKGNIELDTDDENITYTGEGGGIDDGGLPSQMIYYLTGVKSKEYYYQDTHAMEAKYIYKILENTLNAPNTILNFGIYDNLHTCKLTDGSTFSLDVGSGGHALAVTKVTNSTVTFVNPWDSTVEYCATWEEFANLKIGYIASADLNQTVEKEVVDMTDYKKASVDDVIKPDYSDYKYDYKDDYSYNYDYKSDYNYNYDYNYDYSDYSKGDFYSKLEIINKIMEMIENLYYSLFSLLKF
ncbi:hypothetical protein IJ531_03120 [bacterium]|nr:hypothetical protein [bacterium]